METLAGNNPLEYGFISFALLVVWKLLDVAKTLFLAKRVEPAMAGQLGLACQQDPLYSQRIKDIWNYTESTKEQITHGDFSCQWKDRDEVRDFMEIMRQQTTASKAQTQAITALTQEMRLTRNGGLG